MGLRFEVCVFVADLDAVESPVIWEAMTDDPVTDWCIQRMKGQ